jgi:hypothetical protein
MVTELEEVPMAIVGGLDIHRKQLTFDWVDGRTTSGNAAGSARPTGSTWPTG